MRVQVIDALGLKGFQSVIQVDVAAPGMKGGDILEVWGDCPSLEEELRFWCKITRKTLHSVEHDSLMKKIRIKF
jgi:TusA-related sulfurtransferase